MWTDSAIGYRLSAIGRLLKALFGMPDYQRYLAHQAKCHTGAGTMSEKEFVLAELERKHAGGAGRCC
jgi:uncharacterized short protein YbdD (DUF466 family)